MANQPHPSRQAVTWRLPRDLVTQVKARASGNGETVLAFVTRALTQELDRTTPGSHRSPRPRESVWLGDPPMSTDVDELVAALDAARTEIKRLRADRDAALRRAEAAEQPVQVLGERQREQADEIRVVAD